MIQVLHTKYTKFSIYILNTTLIFIKITKFDIMLCIFYALYTFYIILIVIQISNVIIKMQVNHIKLYKATIVFLSNLFQRHRLQK